MSLSSISIVERERFAMAVNAFAVAGVSYSAWVTEDGPGRRVLWWRTQAGAEGTEIRSAVPAQYAKVSILEGAGSTMLVAYCDADASVAGLWLLRLDVATGAVVAGPTRIATGTSPSLARLPGASMLRLTIFFARVDKGSVYLRESFDGGLTWGDERPVLNNKVAGTSEIVAVPYDETHVSVGQIGDGARAMQEMGSVSRTRPVQAALRTGEFQFLVVEPAVRTGQTSDNLRGHAALDGLGNVLTASRARQGSSDGIGDLALYNGQGDTPSLIRSATLAVGAAPGGELVRAPADASGAGSVIHTVPANEAIVDLAVNGGYALYASYGEVAGTGRAGWVDLVTPATFGTLALIASGAVTRCSAVAVGNTDTGNTAAVAVGYAADGFEWLSVASFASPPSAIVFSKRHRMPAKVNAVAVKLTTATTGLLYVGLTDRVNVYRYDGPTQPIRLLRSNPLLTGGEVHDLKVTTGGNVVAALGKGGVAVYNSEGEALAQLAVSDIVAMPWKPSTAYALNATVRATPSSPYFPQRKNFIASRGGTSGTMEPNWGVTNGGTGFVDDPNAAGVGWSDAGASDARVTDLALDPTVGNIYAVAVLGGATGTQGRVYCIDTAGLISDPPRASTPVFRGATHLSLYTGRVGVEILCSTPGATIYYTLDGSAPTRASAVYDGTPLDYTVSGDFRIRAYAEAPGLRPSQRADLRFFIDLPNVDPVKADPAAGTYQANQQVTLYTDLIGTVIRYTTDGSTPNGSSPIFDPQNPIPVNQNTVIKAYATKFLYDDSTVATHSFIIVKNVIPRDDAHATSHLLVANGALLDFIGGAGWGVVGAPTFDAITSIFGQQKEGVRGFTDAIYLAIAVGNGAFDAMMGNSAWAATFVFKSGTGTGTIFNDNNGSTTGLYLTHNAPTNNLGLSVNLSAASRQELTIGPDIRDGGVHVVTIARSGTNYFLKVDGRAVITFTTPAFVTPATANTTFLGRDRVAGSPWTGGIFYECRFNVQAVDATILDALHAAIMGV